MTLKLYIAPVIPVEEVVPADDVVPAPGEVVAVTATRARVISVARSWTESGAADGVLDAAVGATSVGVHWSQLR